MSQKNNQDQSDCLLNLYQAACDAKQIQRDEKQWKALLILQQVYQAILQENGRWYWFKKESPKGVYLYGQVGTGKTFLMDLFYTTLPVKKKIRLHFHQFMDMVHKRLKALQGEKNPLKLLAKELAYDAQIICFDEFFVVNIVDAMILANLLEALYHEKITLVMTSNVYPDELYKGGLQYDRFAPAIALIKKHNHIIEVNSGTDYRLTKADYDRAYFYPQNKETQEILLSQFKNFAGSAIEYQKEILLNQRPVQTLYLGRQAIWFDFIKLCSIPRSQLDYLELSREYAHVFMSNLRHIQDAESDLICNFINLVDVFYDARIKLFICASVPIKDIYTEGELAFAFARTQSRLMEMQAESYLHADVR